MRKEQGAFRQLTINSGLIDFSSNDYLGFAVDSEIQRDIIDCFSQYHTSHGSTGSRLISGNTNFALKLESEIAQYHGAQAALIFNSGYDANIGLLSSIAERGDTIFYDNLSHASIRDGIRLSDARSYSFRHNDLNDLELKSKNAKGDVWVVVESLYSMDGDQAPLEELIEFCNKRGFYLIIDEAHALGVYGEKGEGLVNQPQLIDSVFARIVTFGKALGCHGAAILGSKELIDYLINFARSFIYSTALPITSLSAIKVGYDYLPKVVERRKNLYTIINYFLENFKFRDYLIPSRSQIQALIIAGNQDILDLSNNLKLNGISLHAIRAPTVPNGKERLRISLHSFNSKNDLNKLLTALHLLLR